MNTERWLVTGATGFVGRTLCSQLLAQGVMVRAALRSPPAAANLPDGIKAVCVGDIGAHTDWQAALDDVQVVVHLAARVHVLREASGNPLCEFLRVNAGGTQRLAEAAAAASVRRFVHLSSVHAMCRVSEQLLDEHTVCRPDSPYGQSKLAAEQALRHIALGTGLESVVVRPPPVYGPRNAGNLRRLFDVVARGWPLPLGRLENRRSFIFVDNLVDAIIACGTHRAAAGETFLVSDGDPLSTVDLVRRLGAALGRPARLIDVPVPALRLAGRMIGASGAAERLLGSLAVDSGHIRRTLDWHPPYSLDQGLQITADWLLHRGAAADSKAA
jgi:nucleoside-diphosphate-sugar epimerase